MGELDEKVVGARRGRDGGRGVEGEGGAWRAVGCCVPGTHVFWDGGGCHFGRLVVGGDGDGLGGVLVGG